MDKLTIKDMLRSRHINVRSLCRDYDLPYKTIMGWLNGSQKKLNAETTMRFSAIINKIQGDTND
jgi:hypothetical protein